MLRQEKVNGLMALVLVILPVCFCASRAADWPMWRCDAGRTAASDQELPAELHLQWVRQYPALKPAWSGVRDLSTTKGTTSFKPGGSVGFEIVYSPIVLGQTMFVGSSHNDSLTAIDVETGEEKWRFYTEGPVRLAPAGWKGPSTGSPQGAGQARVYVASDDGFLYCLDANEGKLLWKFRGAPMDHRIVGDERLVSAWPARGGPVVADNRVYFAASIFPFMGVYVYALDAETGKAVWTNNAMGSKWKPKGRSTAPQGPLAVVGNALLIPNNRMSVTVLDRVTGAFLYHPPQSSHWRVCGAGDYFFLEGRGGGRSATVHDLKTGQPVAQLPGMPALAAGAAYWVDAYRKKAVIEGDPAKIEPAADAKKAAKTPVPQRWSLRLNVRGGRNCEVKAKAGSRLYVSYCKQVIAVDIPRDGVQAKQVWSAEIEGEVGDVIAAAGRLFVVTMEGGIYCFGPEKVASKSYSVERRKLPAVQDEWTENAKRILESTGVKDGYALVLGVGSGRLAEELLKQSGLTVIAVDPDAKKIDALRRRLDAAGLYGQRAQAIVGDPLDCGLPPYLASLIVSEDPKAGGIDKGAASVRRIFRSLRPYGGALSLPAGLASEPVLKGWVKSAGLEKAKVKQAGELTLLTRAGPLPGSAPWTHQNADAGNTLCSKDDLVRAPLGLLWFGGPSTNRMFDRHYCGPRPNVVGGRIFILGTRGLTAIDVYTGRLLWQVTSPEITAVGSPYQPSGGYSWDLVGATVLGSPYVSLADGIYVAGGKTCMRLDPETGEKCSEIHLPLEGKPDGYRFGPIRIWENVLVAAVDPIGKARDPTWKYVRGKTRLLRRDGWTWLASREIAAFDRNTGKRLWSLAAKQGFCHNAVAAGNGKVFCIDRWPADAKAKPEGGTLMALDARTGKKAWSTDENVFGTWLAFSEETGILLQSAYGKRSARGGHAIAYDAESGKALWEGKVGGGPLMLNGNMLINQSRGACDIRTGKRLKSYKRLGGKSCDYDIGGRHIVADREFSIAYVDLDTGMTYRLGGVRSGCINTLIQADGVFNAPYSGTGCGCGLNIRTSMALIHMPELAGDKKGEENAKVDAR